MPLLLVFVMAPRAQFLERAVKIVEDDKAREYSICAELDDCEDSYEAIISP